MKLGDMEDGDGGDEVDGDGDESDGEYDGGDDELEELLEDEEELDELEPPPPDGLVLLSGRLLLDGGVQSSFSVTTGACRNTMYPSASM